MPSNKRKSIVVGLTGGIASGKSSVSKLLKEKYHCPVVDADQLAHAITAPGGKALPLIVERFGEGVLTPDGALDRGLLRRKMTEDPDVKAALEAIQYPILQQVILEAIADHQKAGTPLVVYDCPMFFSNPSGTIRGSGCGRGVPKIDADRAHCRQGSNQPRFSKPHARFADGRSRDDQPRRYSD